MWFIQYFMKVYSKNTNKWYKHQKMSGTYEMFVFSITLIYIQTCKIYTLSLHEKHSIVIIIIIINHRTLLSPLFTFVVLANCWTEVYRSWFEAPVLWCMWGRHGSPAGRPMWSWSATDCCGHADLRDTLEVVIFSADRAVHTVRLSVGAFHTRFFVRRRLQRTVHRD